MRHIAEVENTCMKKELPVFHVGDTVEVNIKIKEGDRERVQTFSGTVIGRKGDGTRETFTVRRIVAGEGVERVFPIQSPLLTDVKVTRRGKVRRAKLYYLRDRVGKSTKVKELIEDRGGKKKSRIKKRGKNARQRKEAAKLAEAQGKKVEPKKTKQPITAEK